MAALLGLADGEMPGHAPPAPPRMSAAALAAPSPMEAQMPLERSLAWPAPPPRVARLPPADPLGQLQQQLRAVTPLADVLLMRRREGAKALCSTQLLAGDGSQAPFYASMWLYLDARAPWRGTAEVDLLQCTRAGQRKATGKAAGAGGPGAQAELPRAPLLSLLPDGRLKLSAGQYREAMRTPMPAGAWVRVVLAFEDFAVTLHAHGADIAETISASFRGNHSIGVMDDVVIEGDERLAHAPSLASAPTYRQLLQQPAWAYAYDARVEPGVWSPGVAAPSGIGSRASARAAQAANPTANAMGSDDNFGAPLPARLRVLPNDHGRAAGVAGGRIDATAAAASAGWVARGTMLQCRGGGPDTRQKFGVCAWLEDPFGKRLDIDLRLSAWLAHAPDGLPVAADAVQGGVPPLLVRSTAATEEGAGEAELPQHLFDASRASLPMARGHAEVALSVSALSDACHGSIFCVGLMPHAPELRVPYLLAFSQPFRSVGSGEPVLPGLYMGGMRALPPGLDARAQESTSRMVSSWCTRQRFGVQSVPVSGTPGELATEALEALDSALAEALAGGDGDDAIGAYAAQRRRRVDTPPWQARGTFAAASDPTQSGGGGGEGGEAMLLSLGIPAADRGAYVKALASYAAMGELSSSVMEAEREVVGLFHANQTKRSEAVELDAHMLLARELQDDALAILAAKNRESEGSRLLETQLREKARVNSTLRTDLPSLPPRSHVPRLMRPAMGRVLEALSRQIGHPDQGGYKIMRMVRLRQLAHWLSDRQADVCNAVIASASIVQIAKVLAREAAQLVTRSPQTAAQIFVRAPPAAQRLVLEALVEGFDEIHLQALAESVATSTCIHAYASSIMLAPIIIKEGDNLWKQLREISKQHMVAAEWHKGYVSWEVISGALESVFDASTTCKRDLSAHDLAYLHRLICFVDPVPRDAFDDLLGYLTPIVRLLKSNLVAHSWDVHVPHRVFSGLVDRAQADFVLGNENGARYASRSRPLRSSYLMRITTAGQWPDPSCAQLVISYVGPQDKVMHIAIAEHALLACEDDRRKDYSAQFKALLLATVPHKLDRAYADNVPPLPSRENLMDGLSHLLLDLNDESMPMVEQLLGDAGSITGAVPRRPAAMAAPGASTPATAVPAQATARDMVMPQAPVH